MPEIRSLKDIEEVLAEVVKQTTKDMFAGLTLERTLRLAEAVGSPHTRLKVVHVAGTSGKTSTSYMTAHLLRRAGKKVGLTVSPYVLDMRERVQLEGELMSEAEFIRYFNEFRLLTEHLDFTPTYFEYMMVFALWVFDAVNVDYAVVETGLGGLLDASNICREADKVCVITDIGYDHMQILGNTLGEIAAQKAGIIAPDNKVVLYEQGAEVMAVVREAAAKNGAELIEIQPQPDDLFMQRNARLSCAAYNTVATRDGLPGMEDMVVDELAQLKVPGRLESIKYNGTQVLLDGAHNQQKMQALTAALQALHPSVRWSAVYAMKADKDFRTVVAEIAPLLERVIVVPLKAGGDMPIEYVTPEELSEEFRRHGVIAEIAQSAKEGLDMLTQQSDVNILVTGSLYLVAEAIKEGGR